MKNFSVVAGGANLSSTITSKYNCQVDLIEYMIFTEM